MMNNCLIVCEFSSLPQKDKGDGQMEEEKCGDVMKEGISDFPGGMEMDE